MVLADLGKSINQAISGAIGTNGQVDQAGIDSAVNEIAKALLRHDVGLPQVAQLSKNVKANADLQDVAPHQRKHIIQKVVYDELVKLITPHNAPPPFTPKKGRSSVIMLVGLQGAGKTTTATKLALYYNRRGLKVGLVCADTFRAGAFDQLKQNAIRAKIPFYGSYSEPDPAVVAKEGVSKFRKEKFDVIIVDTSGRHQQETELFDEMIQIGEAVNPQQTLLVLDSSIGQAAKSQASAFKKSSNFGAIIMTKMDGHAKGGGAISAVAATQTPIAFIGTGEHVYDLEMFDSDRFVSRLLGIGDLQGLMEKVQNLKLDNKKTMQNIQEGVFTLRDLRAQIENIMKLGPLSSIASMIPGMSQFADQMGGDDSTLKLKKMIYICDSMTSKELDSDAQVFEREPSRLVRLAKGSGTSVYDVEETLVYHKTMSSVVKKMGGQNGLMSQMQRQQQQGAVPGAKPGKQARGGRQVRGQPNAPQLPGGGMPQLPGMPGGMPGGMPQIPGMPDMSSLFKNGMPDMSEMMNMVQSNPALKNMMKQFGAGI